MAARAVGRGAAGDARLGVDGAVDRRGAVHVVQPRRQHAEPAQLAPHLVADAVVGVRPVAADEVPRARALARHERVGERADGAVGRALRGAREDAGHVGHDEAAEPVFRAERGVGRDGEPFRGEVDHLARRHEVAGGVVEPGRDGLGARAQLRVAAVEREPVADAARVLHHEVAVVLADVPADDRERAAVGEDGAGRAAPDLGRRHRLVEVAADVPRRGRRLVEHVDVVGLAGVGEPEGLPGARARAREVERLLDLVEEPVVDGLPAGAGPAVLRRRDRRVVGVEGLDRAERVRARRAAGQRGRQDGEQGEGPAHRHSSPPIWSTTRIVSGETTTSARPVRRPRL